MSFGWLDKITDQVLRYSTFVGQLWYVLTFVFRLIVVAGLGSSVYGDEQSNFKCNQDSPGCEIACYNQFTALSHLRFWAFQMLAVTAPIVAFHFIATYFAGQIKKLLETRKHLNDEDDDYFANERHRRYEEEKLRRRQKIVGNFKTKRVFADGDLKEIPINDKIRLAYFVSTVIRLAAEGIFLYLTWTLYNYPDYSCTATRLFQRKDASSCYVNGTGLDFLFAEFPEFYPCRRLETVTGIDIACTQHVALNGHVPCWTSRAWEKTIFLRYMNIMSSICFLLCALEIVIIPFTYMQHKSAKNRVQVVYRDERPDDFAVARANDYRDPRAVDYRDPRAMTVYEDRQTNNYQDRRADNYRDPRADDVIDGPEKQLVDLPLRSQPSAIYSTTHAHANYPSRRNSYYDEREQPQHPPPIETSVKKYDEYK